MPRKSVDRQRIDRLERGQSENKQEINKLKRENQRIKGELSRLTEIQIAEKLRETDDRGRYVYTYQQLADMFRVPISTIRRIANENGISRARGRGLEVV